MSATAPSSEPLVQVGACLLRQRPVGRVPDQDVAEAERVVVAEGRALRPDQVTSDQLAQGPVDDGPERLRRELVDTKVMTNKQFHDEVMRQGNMPIALIRLAVTRQKLTRDMDVIWKFYGELPEK